MTAWPEDVRCDRCRFWLRNDDGEPVYPQNRSQCAMEGAGFGIACTTPGATATTEAHFGCVLFQPREQP